MASFKQLRADISQCSAPDSSIASADHWQNVITHYRRPFAERVADVLMAVILGLSGAVFLFHYLSR